MRDQHQPTTPIEPLLVRVEEAAGSEFEPLNALPDARSRRTAFGAPGDGPRHSAGGAPG